jgi:hypothetical protein
MDDVQGLRALVVYESFFGNTESIARAVAGGLRLEHLAASAVDVSDTRGVDPASYDLLVVGAPTHAFALSRPSTRIEAVAHGGDDGYTSGGMREWLAGLPVQEGTRLGAVFDTRVSRARHLPMSASRSAARLMREHRFELVVRPAGFVVQDLQGPLEQRELKRAVAWGRRLARETQSRVTVDADHGGRPGW